jgi:hypothetical protein
VEADTEASRNKDASRRFEIHPSIAHLHPCIIQRTGEVLFADMDRSTRCESQAVSYIETTCMWFF